MYSFIAGTIRIHGKLIILCVFFFTSLEFLKYFIVFVRYSFLLFCSLLFFVLFRFFLNKIVPLSVDFKWKVVHILHLHSRPQHTHVLYKKM